jgi:aspartate kinase
VAGFQGVSYKREITTLGRGGTDTTAVALAAALDAERCEIYSDVDGVYTADPNQIASAEHLPSISYEEMQEMAMAGAKVLKEDAVEFAKRAGIAIYARASFAPGRETIVRRDIPKEEHGVRAVVSERDVALVGFLGRAVTDRVLDILKTTEENILPIKELRFQCPRDQVTWARGSFVVSPPTLPDWGRARKALQEEGGEELEIVEGLSALSLIGVGLNRDTQNVTKAINAMHKLNAPVLGLSTSGFRISLITEVAFLDAALVKMHELFIENKGQVTGAGDQRDEE